MKNKVKNKNIALILPCINGGGAERIGQILAEYYLDRGHHVFFFLLENTRRAAYEVHGEIEHLGIDFYDITICKLIRSANVLRKAKVKYCIDVAISFMEESNYLNVLSKGKERTIVSVHTVLSARKELSGLLYNPQWMRTVYNCADVVVAVSEYVKYDLNKNYGIRKNKLYVIPNSALKHDNSGIQEWKYGDKAIVTVGRLEPVKQQDRLIRAFSYVKNLQPDAQLILIGDGKLRRYLERVIHELSLDSNVHMVGFTDSPGKYVKNARAFVMTSKAEGFPNAMVEAMAYGVPIITTDTPGGCGEIVGKQCSSEDIQYCSFGVLTPLIEGRVKITAPLEQEEILLAKAMLSIITDDEKAIYYSSQSRKRAEYYSLHRVMKKWDKAIGLG